MIKSRGKWLKILQAREDKLSIENKELCESNKTKEAKALSIMKVIEGSNKVESRKRSWERKYLNQRKKEEKF